MMAAGGGSIGDIPEFQVVLVGSPSVGKTAYVYKALHGIDREEKYTGGRGYDPLVFHTTRGWIKMKLWDVTVQEGCTIKDYEGYKMRDAAIIMFDVGDQKSYAKVGKWCEALRFTEEEAKKRVKPCQCPMVLVGSKDDLGGAIVSTQQVEADHYGKGLEFVRISSRISPPELLRLPLLHLGRKLLGDPELEFFPIEREVAERLRLRWGTTQFKYPEGVGCIGFT